MIAGFAANPLQGICTAHRLRFSEQYCRHKQSNRGYATFNGRQVFFDGDYDSPEGWEDYHRTVAEWLANGRTLRFDDDEESITVSRLQQTLDVRSKLGRR